MIDAEKLLGGLLSKGLRGGGRRSNRRRSSLPGGLTGAMGMGILGVAIAACDHLSKQKKNVPPGGSSAVPPQHPGGAGRSVSPPPPPAGGPSAPRPSVPADASSGPKAPPPPPGAGSSSGAGETAPAASTGQEKALLLLRAMIAAANADRIIDDNERKEIADYLEEAGLTDEEKSFMHREIDSPPEIEQLIAAVDTPDLARQFYAISLLTIVADTEEEQNYLRSLKDRLRLDDKAVAELHAQFEEGP